MPRYAPQSLPTGGSRPPIQQDMNADDTEENVSQNYGQPAILLGQHIRRERGMQGVQRYVVSMREHLTESEYEDLCHALGVPTDLQLPQQHRNMQHQTMQQENAYPAQPQQPQAAQQNNMQMLQMLMQLMGGMNGGGMGGGMGGMNPMMLAQMLQNGMGGMNGGGMNGMNPLMLAQMLSSMQGK